MIQVEHIDDDEWLVTVVSDTTTQHRVTVTRSDLHRFGADKATAEQLLKASFRFLLEREPNTSILSSFELSVITHYFPGFERQIAHYLRS